MVFGIEFFRHDRCAPVAIAGTQSSLWRAPVKRQGTQGRSELNCISPIQ
jgi:hypothetical protein